MPTKGTLKISGPARQRYLPLLCALMTIIAFAAIAGCTSQAPATTTATQKTSQVVSIGEITRNPAAYNKTDVLVQGKITGECGSGCWFMLDDGTGLIYVDLSQNNFAIPQLQGSTISVEGTVYAAGGDITLFAKTVKTGSRTYP